MIISCYIIVATRRTRELPTRYQYSILTRRENKEMRKNNIVMIASVIAAIVCDFIACLNDNIAAVCNIFMGLCLVSLGVFIVTLVRYSIAYERAEKSAVAVAAAQSSTKKAA